MRTICLSYFAALILAFFSFTSAQDTTVITINNTCTVNKDITSSIVSGLPIFLNQYVLTAQAAVSFLSSNLSIDVLGGNQFAPDSFLRNYLWSLAVAQTPATFIDVGFHNGFFMQYTYDSENQLVWNYCPANSNILSYYYVNQTNGYPLSEIPYKTQTYYVTQRPWYVGAEDVPANNYIWVEYGSATSTNLDFSVCRKFNITSPPYGGGVISNTLYLQASSIVATLSQFIESFNGQADTVAYIMQSDNYLLLGTSVGATVSLTLKANESTNSYISGSCNYIIANQIEEPISVYSKQLGYSITVKYFTSGSGSSYIKWTVVAADYSNTQVYQTVSTVSYSANSNDDASTVVKSEITSTLALICLAILLLILVLVQLNARTSKSGPLAKQEGIQIGVTSTI